MIEVRNLKIAFGSLEAVCDVSFDVQRGEAFGLLGPNGAGKTTTLKMVVGSLAPDSGSVTIDKLLPSDHGFRKLVGVAPQSLALYDQLSAAENLTFFAKLYGLSGSRLKERVQFALDFAQLDKRRRDRVGTFSGGMKRRLNLAAAITHDPQVILMDEPTVGVDPQSRNHIFDLIERLRDEGRTIIYTTHYMEEAERLCDRVAIIDHGKLLDMDRVESLIQKHVEDSTVEAELIEIPGNLESLPGELDGTRLKFKTCDPMSEIAKLNSAGVKFASLQVSRPNLESVFLNLTGRSLRD